MIKSYCKINLSLKVIKKKKKGLHDIQTNSFLLNLHDEINIKKLNKKKDIIIFKGPFKNMVKNSKNSLTITLNLLRKKRLIRKDNFYRITVNKKIPIFSGLGGGTSNAAFILKYFLKKKYDKKILSIFEKKVGSDLRLFFYNQTFQKNLKTILKYKKKFNFHFVLIYPNIKCSTKEIYSKVKKFSKPAKVRVTNITDRSDFIREIRGEKNELQKILTSKFNRIKKIINFISIQKGCYFSRMTGSGSTCYGMFNSQKTAILGMKIIKNKFPSYWCVATKTI